MTIQGANRVVSDLLRFISGDASAEVITGVGGGTLGGGAGKRPYLNGIARIDAGNSLKIFKSMRTKKSMIHT